MDFSRNGVASKAFSSLQKTLLEAFFGVKKTLFKAVPLAFLPHFKACFLMKKRRSRSKSESDDDAEIPIKFDVKSRAPPPPRSLYALLRTLSTSALAVGRSRSAASDVRRWSIEREFFSRSIDFFFFRSSRRSLSSSLHSYYDYD